MGKRTAKGRRLSKGAVTAIISIASAAVVICTLLIVNIFYPLKYITAFLVSGSRSPEGELNVHILDVGQADCAIVELPDGKTMLIDGGDGSYKNTLRILTELGRLDIDTIDYLICTSVSDEHCGGLAEIIKYKTVGTIYYPYCNNRYITDGFRTFCSAAESSGAELVISEYGVGAESGDDFFFCFLSPSNHLSPLSEYADLNSDPTQENIDNASAVLWIEYAGAGIFWAGDARTDVLELIADVYVQGLEEDYFSFNGHTIDFSRCALYKVAAHGSENSRCTTLTDILMPGISVISVGADNAEGCPAASVMTDLAAWGDIYLTQYAGSVNIRISADGSYSAT